MWLYCDHRKTGIGIGSISKRSNVWNIDVRAGGKRIRKRVGPSKKIAELELKDAEVKIARDEFGFANNDIPIDKFLERFLEYSTTDNLPATFVRYRSVLDNFKRFLKLQPKLVFLSQK